MTDGLLYCLLHVEWEPTKYCGPRVPQRLNPALGTNSPLARSATGLAHSWLWTVGAVVVVSYLLWCTQVAVFLSVIFLSCFFCFS